MDVDDREGEIGDDEAPRRRRFPVLVLAALAVLGLGLGLGFGLFGGGSSAPRGSEGVPVVAAPNLAPADTTASGAPVGGITCTTGGDVKDHVHVHVAIYVDGSQRRLPAGAGIAAPRLDEHLSDGLFVDNGAKGCLYWLHVHADDDVIHVESPTKHTFTLGQFFDIWRQSLGPDRVGPARGAVVAFENGKRFRGSPRDIPLLPHAVIQLDVGSPVVAFQPVRFTVVGLCGASAQSCAVSGG